MKTHHADSQSVASADQTSSQTATETYYGTLFDYAPDGILIADRDSRYLDANPSMCRMLGFSRGEIVGKHAADIVAPLEAHHIGAALKELSADTDHHRQWQFKRKDGSQFTAEVTATKMSDGNLLAMVRDISERRQSEAISTRLASIVESSDDAIISNDLANIITSWNSGAEKIFGYSAAEILGSSACCLVPAQYCEEEEAVQRQIGAGHGIEQFETVRRTKDGRLIDVSITAAPLKDAAGIVVGSSKIMRDVTVAKVREREISTLTRLYSALSQVNHALVRVSTRAELLQEICRVLVRQGGFKMVWIGWFQPDTRQIIPIADCGDEDGHIHEVKIYGDERPEGCGPTGLAFRSEKPFICNDLQNDPIVLPWREGMVHRGFRSGVSPKNLVANQCVVYRYTVTAK